MTDALFQAAPEPPTIAEAVREYLLSDPSFLHDDPDLVAALGLRLDAANVIDFGPAALSRVSAAHRKETTVRKRLEAVAHANFAAQAQTHEAVVELLDARNHSDLARRLDDLARARFGLEAGVLALEGPERVPAGWKALAEGQVEMTLGPGRKARLGVVPTALGLFGERAPGVGSLALVRLAVWTPERAGVLAFASADPEAFHADMGHELVSFLARVVERTAQRWPVL
ncbi:MAG: DUF484 family protein [Caulobacterales bacterium]